MSHILRQSTQVVVRIGPFMDSVDAVTPETGITLGAADQAEALKAAGAATADISGNTWAAITGAGGWYDLTLTTTDTNTIGDLTIVVQDTSVCLPVFARFQVIEEVTYDALYAASANAFAGAAGSTTLGAGAITATVIATGAIDADAIAADAITAAKVADGTIDAATFAAGAINAAAIANGAIDAATFAAGAIDATAIANGAIDAATFAAGAIDAAALAADASAEIADAVWDEDATLHQTTGTFGQAIGDPVADTNTIYKAVVTDATGVTVGTDTATLLTRMGTPSDLGGGATVAANLVDIESQTDDIGVAGAGLTAINLPDQVMNITGDITGNLSGSVGSVTGAVGSVTGSVGSVVGLTASNLDATVSSRATPAQVNTEVLDVLNVDTFAEPGQATPGATMTLAQKIGYLFKAWRNRSTQTATDYKLYNDDAVTVDQKASTSDDAVTFDRGEVATGP